MSLEALKENIAHSKEIIREIYIFSNQLEIIHALESKGRSAIDENEKRLLVDAISGLWGQLRILNGSIPSLVENIGFYKQLETTSANVSERTEKIPKKLIQIKYKPGEQQSDISLTISEKDRMAFLENLSKSNLSINQLKKKYGVEKPTGSTFGKPNFYAKISNKLFREFSNKLLQKGKLDKINKDLRKMNSPFLVTTYTSMIFFTMIITLVASIFIFILLLFYNIGLTFPFLSPYEGDILTRIIQTLWIIIVIPSTTGILMYLYPSSEAKNIGGKIDQELPFITIHMSAISTSGVEPQNIFKIILKSKEYKYSNMEFRKLINLVNFQGYDLVTALKKSAKSSPSVKLRELLNGFATAITSGGNLHEFLDKHADTLLFDYKLEREKYTKTSETFMDIYISVVIAAPMILLMLFIIMGSTGMNWMGISSSIMGFLIILMIAFLNAAFLMFLKLKQPVF
ncbi:MAG: type II secretion system F family protein [Candidatus Pacearchaeota archaeon]